MADGTPVAMLVNSSGDQKRKRGRPRKQQMPDATLLSSGDQKQKKALGSPKKKETEAIIAGQCTRMPFDKEELELERTDSPNFYRKKVEGPISFAINQINAETGHNYKLVDIVRVVIASSVILVFPTFTAADVDGVVRTFQAKVKSRTRGVPQYELDEWKILGKRGRIQDIINYGMLLDE